MTVTEKVAYLKGLAEGLGIEEDSKEGKLLKAVMDGLASRLFRRARAHSKTRLQDSSIYNNVCAHILAVRRACRA